MKPAIEVNEHQKIIDLYLSGMKQSEIAKMYLCNQTTISALLRKYGIKGISNRKLVGNVNDEIVELYNSGLEQKQIAQIYDCSQSRIQAILSQRGIKGRTLIPEDKKRKIIEFYEKGHTQEEVSKKFHVGYHSVARILCEYNVYVRPKTEANRTYTFNEHYFDEVNTPNKAYILGLLYADGCNYNNYVVTLKLQERDVGILKKICIEMESNQKPIFHADNQRHPTHQNTYSIQFVSPHMAYTLTSLGCMPRKSLKLKYPTWLDASLQPHFLRGYLDGDGTISKNPKKMSAGFVGTKSFILEAANFLSENMGWHCYVRCVIEHSGEDDDTYELAIRKKTGVCDFLDYLYQDADLYLERKFQIYQSIYQKAV